MLEIRHLTKRFNGIPVVEDVSFNIRPSEILGYVGPNGAGLIPAYGLARLMASAVGDSAPRNPFALVGIPLVLGLSAALASHIPARRATRIGPLAALRDE